jgi:transposase
MSATVTPRFIGLDVHKHYLIAVGVDADLHEVLGPRRVPLSDLGAWINRTLTLHDAVVLEMTTNTWQLYDDLVPHVGSVTVVHPPHIALITRARVMTDTIAARALARLHAAGLTVGIWIPSPAVRDQRAVLAQRAKMVRLATQAKNRLHAVLHRHHLALPEGALFAPAQRPWWLGLPVSALERERIRSDLDTLAFAEREITALGAALLELASADERVPLLLQVPGVSQLSAQTILAAVGDIRRFTAPEKLVGYAGLGAGVHDSGETTRRGRITKAGRRDLRTTMVEAAQTAANTHPHWMAELARLEPRLGHNKAIVAIARKLLVAVWYVWHDEQADRHAVPQIVARKFLAHAYRLGPERRAAGQSTAAYAREQLDRLGLGMDLRAVPWAHKRPIPLPPSRLTETAREPSR